MKKKLVVQTQDICFTGSYCLLFGAIALLLGAPPWFLAVIILFFMGLHYSTLGSPIFWHYWNDQPWPSVQETAMLNKTITIQLQQADKEGMREILGDAIQPDLSLHGLRQYEEYVRWSPGDSKAQLQGNFSSDELRAIAGWMDSHS